ncbi:MAG: B12-binding domain-containing radical SAM protein [Acidimicrobiales bacterium]
MSDTAERVFIELGEKETPAAISGSLLVLVGLRGPIVPAYDEFPPLALGMDSMAFLEEVLGGDHTISSAIDAVESRMGVNATALFSFAEELKRRGLLVTERHEQHEVTEAPTFGDEVDLDDAGSDAELNALAFAIPIVLSVGPRGFEQIDHDGQVLSRMTAPEMHAATRFCVGTSIGDAYEQHRDEAQGMALSNDEHAALLRRLRASSLIAIRDPDAPEYQKMAINRQRMRDGNARRRRVVKRSLELVAEYEAREDEIEAQTGFRRVRVIPIENQLQPPPLALGCLVAYAKAFEGGVLNDTYSYHPRFFFPAEQDVVDLGETPSIYLFSNYVWSVDDHLQLSKTVKERSPASITIHGGPSTPKYEEDAQQFFVDHPHVDVAVRGEGEETFAHVLKALEASSRDGAFDLEVLREVEGVSFIDADGQLVRTPDRDRIADLDIIPSPLLTGLFDAFAAGPIEHIVLETNRGCPYGCTFCDWGSATASRIRKFDLDRVNEELEWIAKAEIHNIGIADANFGIFSRDVDLANFIVELNKKYGFPRAVGPNYAKNTVKHLRPIIESWADAGILADGKVALQSMDEETLTAIRRKNIKTEKYNQLAEEFRQNKLPLSVDIMMGLPGSTVASFADDMQSIIDRDVHAAIHETTLLPNSPMNAADYRAEHGITAKVGEIVKETNSYTRDEWDHMGYLRSATYVFDMAGVARHVGRFARQETGRREIELFDQMVRQAIGDPGRWPTLSYALRAIKHRMIAPATWRWFVDELHQFAVEQWGLPDDSALQTVIAVQHAVLPATGREFPIELELAHDYVAWNDAVVAARNDGHHFDWEKQPLRRLSEFGPARFVVEDADDACTSAIGQNIDRFIHDHANWDLAASIGRARVAAPEEARHR